MKPAIPIVTSAGARLAQVEEIEVEVERLVAGGDGLARFEGIPIFIARSAPGDRVRARLTERKPDYGRAEIVAILVPGPGRREAPCPHFARCGGCDLQHLEDSLQTKLKAEAVLETLVRLAGIRVESPQIVAGEAWGYRLRTQLHTERRGEGVAVGYFARGTHDLVAIERCPILAPELEQFVQELPARLTVPAPSRLDLAAGAASGGGAEIACAPNVEGLPHGELSLKVGEFTYRYDARCFFQAHRGLLDRLVGIVVGDREGSEAYDLYCGAGLFALPLARRYGRVVGVEGDTTAARFARINARRNRVANLEIVARSLEGWIRALPSGAARVIVDPPRAGLGLVVRRILLDRRPQHLTYVSCHPAALARDLRDLREAYEVESLTLVDLFPQTGHMEVVAQLVRKGASVAGC